MPIAREYRHESEWANRELAPWVLEKARRFELPLAAFTSPEERAQVGRYRRERECWPCSRVAKACPGKQLRKRPRRAASPPTAAPPSKRTRHNDAVAA